MKSGHPHPRSPLAFSPLPLSPLLDTCHCAKFYVNCFRHRICLQPEATIKHRCARGVDEGGGDERSIRGRADGGGDQEERRGAEGGGWGEGNNNKGCMR